MARLPRLIVPGLPHHILQRGNDRQPVFRDSEDHVKFLYWLREAARQFMVAIHAYVLMPDHLHLLASPADAQGPGRMMQWIGRHYVPYFNRKYQRAGTLWQGRYRATLVDPDNYFFACARYIEINPVRAGLVMHPAEYPWSSYLHHAGSRVDPVITEHRLFWALGNTPFEREAAYKRIIEQFPSDDEIDTITNATVKGWALGSEQFKTRLESQAKRRVSPAKKGRPAKKME